MMLLTLGSAWSGSINAFALEPADTVRQSEQVLGELMAIPARQIPRRLMDEAQGVVIVPNVVKIGFIAGARRGHGVVLVRDAEGEWSLPQFVTLTGGSVGWQAGVQGTDIVLVFTTRKGVDGLLRGKFTVGVDAAATAGPVGREMAAGTDATLRSEIYSYSRSRGLFLGVAIDGSALEVDHEAHAYYYGSPSSQVPRQIPQSAAQLQHFLVEIAPGHIMARPANERDRPVSERPAGERLVTDRPIQWHPVRRMETLRRSLAQHSAELQAILSPEWQRYLAMPREVIEPMGQPNPETISIIHRKFAKLADSGEYPQLVQRPEFQSTYEVLTELHESMASNRAALQLPPPPSHQ